MRFLGYNTTVFKIIIFTFSAVLAGIAGALYVPQVGIINPGEFSPIKSIEIVVWVCFRWKRLFIWCYNRCYSCQYIKIIFNNFRLKFGLFFWV